MDDKRAHSPKRLWETLGNKGEAKRSEGVRGLITISHTPPGTAPQRFGSLLSQRIARKAAECQCQDAKASGICVGYAKKRVISPGRGLGMSAKSTATKTAISQYSNVLLYYRERSPHFTLSQDRCLEKFSIFRAALALRAAFQRPTSAHHTDTRGAWEKEEGEVCQWNWGCFSALLKRARASLYGCLAFPGWLRNLPD